MRGPIYGVMVTFPNGASDGVVADLSDAQASRLRELLRGHKRRNEIRSYEVTKFSDNALSLAGLQGWLNRNGLNAPS